MLSCHGLKKEKKKNNKKKNHEKKMMMTKVTQERGTHRCRTMDLMSIARLTKQTRVSAET